MGGRRGERERNHEGKPVGKRINTRKRKRVRKLNKNEVTREKPGLRVGKEGGSAVPGIIRRNSYEGTTCADPSTCL